MKSKQFFQIVLPFLVVLLLIGFGAFSIISSEATSLDQAGGVASIYLIFLILPPIFLSILITIISIIMIYKGSSYLILFFPKLHYIVGRASESVNVICSNIAKPIIDLSSYASIFSRNKTEKGKDE